MHQSKRLLLVLLLSCLLNSKEAHALGKFGWSPTDAAQPHNIFMSGAASYGGFVWTFGGQRNPAASPSSPADASSEALKAHHPSRSEYAERIPQSISRKKSRVDSNSSVLTSVVGHERAKSANKWRPAWTLRSSGPWSAQQGTQVMYKMGVEKIERIAYQNEGVSSESPKNRLLPLLCADSQGTLWLIGGVSQGVK